MPTIAALFPRSEKRTDRERLRGWAAGARGWLTAGLALASLSPLAASAQSYSPSPGAYPNGYAAPVVPPGFAGEPLPMPQGESLMLRSGPPIVGQENCPPGPTYEVLPQHRERVKQAFGNALRQSIHGVYGGVEYLNVRFDDADTQIGRFVDGFDARAVRGALFNDQPAELLLSIGNDIDNPLLSDAFDDDLDAVLLASQQQLLAVLGVRDYEAGEPFFIDNVLRGRISQQDAALASQPVDLSEPLLAEVTPINAPFDTDNANGIRGYVGTDWRFGLLEADVWSTGSLGGSQRFDFFPNPNAGLGINSRFDPDPTNDFVPGTTIVDPENNFTFREFVGIPVIYTDPIVDDGSLGAVEVDAPRQGLLLFDDAFSSESSTELGGAGGNVFITIRPDDRWRLYGLTGFRYTRLAEDVRINGQASTALNSVLGGDAVSRDLTLTGRTTNHLYMGQLGFRSEVDLGWMMFGVQPQVGLGAVNRSGRTFSDGLAFNSVATRDSFSHTDLAATFNVSAYGKVHVNRWLRIRFGYEFTAIDDVVRPDGVFDYRTVSTAPAITARDDDKTFSWDQFFIGGEIIIP